MSQWPAGVSRTFSDSAAFFADSIIQVTVTFPTSGGTVTSSQFDVQWAFSPGTQASYRVRIYDDAGATSQVYDSGTVSSPVKLHAVPDGSIASADSFWVRVDITTTLLQAGVSNLIDFTTAFTPVNDVEDLAVAAVNTALPHAALTWTAFVLSGAETFNNYNVYRRIGSGVWIRIATLTNRTGDVSYDDFIPESAQLYEYAVTASVKDGADALESDKQTSSNTATLTFTPVYLHKFSDTSSFVELVVGRASITPRQDIQYLRPWNRAAPNAHVGKGLSSRINMSGIQKWTANKAMCTTVRGCLEDQEHDAELFVLRVREQRFFVTLSQVALANSPASVFNETLSFQEVHKDEAV